MSAGAGRVQLAVKLYLARQFKGVSVVWTSAEGPAAVVSP